MLCMFFFKKKKNKIKDIFQKNSFIKNFKEKNSLHFLNFTQFFGALNDNVYKLLSVFLLIEIKGVAQSGIVIPIVGIIYVIPFLLFSNSGGILADRFSKQRIIIAMKAFEVLITIGAIISFYFRSELGIYSMLFLLSLQSAFFGPPKYSIIPEIVQPQHISKANGQITSATYLAVIIGTFLASFITDQSGNNFVITAVFCFIIAVIGFITSLFIPKTISRRHEKKQKIHPWFIKDIYKTLQLVKNYKFFLLAMSGSFFFLFIGAFLQLNIVPYAIESLGLTEVQGGYLFLSSAIGIATGAVIAGRTSNKKGNLGLACLGMTITSVFLFLLPLVSFSLILTYIVLAILGVGGGMFVVPIDSFIQSYSPDEKRGKIIATSNFLSFCGVLLAPITMFILDGMFNFKSGSSFFIMGIIAVIYTLFFARKISGIFLNYASRKLLYPFFHVEMHPKSFNIKEIDALIAPTPHISYGSLIMGLRTKFHLYIAKPTSHWTDNFWKLFKNIHFIYFEKTPKFVNECFARALKLNLSKEVIPCLIISPSNHPKSNFSEKDFEKLKQQFSHSCSFVSIKESKRERTKWAKLWKPVHIILDFEEKKTVIAPKKKHLLSGIFSKK